MTRIGRDDLPRVSASATVVEERDGRAGDRFRVGISEYVDALTDRTVKVWTDHDVSVGICPTQRCAKLDRLFRSSTSTQEHPARPHNVPYGQVGT